MLFGFGGVRWNINQRQFVFSCTEPTAWRNGVRGDPSKGHSVAMVPPRLQQIRAIRQNDPAIDPGMGNLRAKRAKGARWCWTAEH